MMDAEPNRSARVLIARFLRDERGANAIEYGLIAAIVVVGIIAAIRGYGTNLSSTYNRVGTSITR